MPDTGQPPSPEREEADIRAELRKFDWERAGKFEESITAVAVGALDRAKNAVTIVQATSAALVTIYTGIVGLVFTEADSGLPLRGVIAPLFFGAAVVFTAFYSAYLGEDVSHEAKTAFPTRGTTSSKVSQRINAVVAYVRNIVVRRAWALRAAVVALGFGLVALVFPFVDDADLTALAGGPADGGSDSEWISPDLPTDPPPATLSEPLQALYFQAQIDDAVAEAEAARAALDAGTPAGTGTIDALALIWVLAGGLTIAVVARHRPGRATATDTPQ
ncbi:hypothetical protein [Agromyces larvae]|uniref:Uncharacterized protein n=1 Tax=Agromyces larvae TaxID=2929802 RepID=A0ABY4BZZ8_9MICO|nr:hypothetical protein [Agromyces larvae]UOE43441.1 hypothetical protein MTO99_14825 [Agromyces larvae]